MADKIDENITCEEDIIMLSAWEETKKKIFQYPNLSKEREVELFSRWVEDKNEAAKEELITSHLKLVFKIARFYVKKGNIPFEELFTVGVFGFISVIERTGEYVFDPKKGRLGTIARYTIRQYIREYVHAQIFWEMDKSVVNFERRKREAAEKGKWFPLGDFRVWSLDTPANVVSDAYSEDTIKDLLISEDNNPEENVVELLTSEKRHDFITTAMSSLNPREQEIIQERFLTEPRVVLGELGTRFGISNERVRQVEANALKKLKKFLNKNYGIINCEILV